MVQRENLIKDKVVCVVGLGYVGLPLALAFGRSSLKTYGFDINKHRVSTLKEGLDYTGELSAKEIKNSDLIYTSDEADIKKANFIIVAVPTPVDKANVPDLMLVEKASEMVGRNLTKGAIVVYESTVYPGVTDDICGPILEKVSGLKCGLDFKLGYSPERINPGDKEHTLEKIVKIVSGQDKQSTDVVAAVYETVCLAGVHIAPNIKTAEAAKVIENTQRDLNIALVNELSLIFHRIGIDTTDVLEAAGTKWNFLKFKPGLVGGHCIGIDPYYLVHKAEELGYHPQVIAAGRRVNDFMPEFAADETIKGLIEARKNIQHSKVLVLGLTFKENVKDLRNSKIATTIAKLAEIGVHVYAYEPLIETKEDLLEAQKEFSQVKIIKDLTGKYDAVIVAQAHKEFVSLGAKLLDLMGRRPVVVDIRNAFRHLKDNPEVIYKNL